MPAVRLKICGVTRGEDLRACVAAGVDAVGINLWPGSRRHVSLPAAERMLQDAGDLQGLLKVGVFVDPTPNEIGTARHHLDLDLVQLHGDAPIADYAAMGYDYVWVIRGTPDLADLEVPARPPAWILLDSRSPGYGGAGLRTDWEWARRAVLHLAPVPVWLAGGITPENAEEALAAVEPAGLDVASGAEVAGSTHGEKDQAKIAALVAICQNRSSR
jgi:phosphoribosylanthranilate isomerase